MRHKGIQTIFVTSTLALGSPILFAKEQCSVEDLKQPRPTTFVSAPSMQKVIGAFNRASTRGVTAHAFNLVLSVDRNGRVTEVKIEPETADPYLNSEIRRWATALKAEPGACGWTLLPMELKLDR